MQPVTQPVPKGRVTQRVIDHLDSILEAAHPADFKRDLNEVLLHYIMYECSGLPPDFKTTMRNYIMLFEWLDIIEDEMNNESLE
jgi:hypothetical protein